jgi:hypothetical protein
MMNQHDLRQWLLESITQRFRSNADLSLSDYRFSISLFHSIVEEQFEFSSHIGERSTVPGIDSIKRYTYQTTKASLGE